MELSCVSRGKISMNISLQNNETLFVDKAQIAVQEALGINVADAEKIGQGLNSKVYRVVSKDDKNWIVKFYFRQEGDPRDRLHNEFMSLTFLWNKGIRSIPQPITMDSKESLAIYEFIEGKKIDSLSVTEQDMDDALDFLRQLRELTREDDSGSFSSASEGFFSVEDIEKNILSRCERLDRIEATGDPQKALKDYLHNEFIPFLQKYKVVMKEKMSHNHISYEKEISSEERILSPSDFGFHNAIRRNNHIVFLDFEYFGWDDPTKTLSDILLHPAMNLNDESRRYFAKAFLKYFDVNNHLRNRLDVLYPLFGLKWCLIFLNEFLPGDLKRRHFAQGEQDNHQQILWRQLDKAKVMLANIKDVYQSFPF